MDSEFWAFIDRLVTEHAVVIDRPAGTPHPELKIILNADGRDLEKIREAQCGQSMRCLIIKRPTGGC